MMHAHATRFSAETGWEESFPLLASPHAGPKRCQQLARPERRLMLAILSDAIVLFQQCGVNVRANRRREVRETERWILSDDQRWPCSFVNVCSALGLAHEPLRRMLLRWRATHGNREPTRRRLLAGKTPSPLARTG